MSHIFADIQQSICGAQLTPASGSVPFAPTAYPTVSAPATAGYIALRKQHHHIAAGSFSVIVPPVDQMQSITTTGMSVFLVADGTLTITNSALWGGIVGNWTFNSGDAFMGVFDGTTGLWHLTPIGSSGITGTFTPVLAFGGASTGITYAAQVGSYSVTGKTVTVRLALVLTSKGTAVGVATISGLPFAASTLINARFGGSLGYVTDMTYTGTFLASLDQGATAMDLYLDASGVHGYIADTNFTNTTNLQITLTYHV